MNKKQSQSRQTLIIAVATGVFVLLVILFVLVSRRGEDTVAPELAPMAEQTDTQDNGRTPNATEEEAPTDEEQTDAVQTEPVLPDGNTGSLDSRLPAEWDTLSGSEKIALNPHGCLTGAVIRADNGQCLISGTSISYVFLTRYGSQAFYPPSVAPAKYYVDFGVPDNTSAEDMDKVFDHFKQDVAEQSFGGSFPKVSSFAKATGYYVDIYYYSDFVFDDDAFEGIDFKEDDPGIRIPGRRDYTLRPRHFFGVFGFGGYTGNDSGEDKWLFEKEQASLLPPGCDATIGIKLLYNFDLYHESREVFYGLNDESESDLVYRYGAEDATRADFEAVFLDDQGMLRPLVREELLANFGILPRGIDSLENPDPDPRNEYQYDINIQFYRYDAAKGFNADLYDADDHFEILPAVSVTECL